MIRISSIKKIALFLLTPIILFGLSKFGEAQKVINLCDYGIVSNSHKNASPALAKAIEEAAFGNCIFSFPGGRIDLWPEGAQRKEYYISNATEPDGRSLTKIAGMVFENMKNVTLEGNNTELVFHGKMMMIAIDHCQNFEVRGLRFDYQRPTMSEMKIVSKSDSSVVANINPHSWYNLEKRDDHQELVWYGEGWKVNNSFTAGYRPDQQTMYYSNWNSFAASRAEEISPFKVKFLGNFKSTKFRAGDILSIRDPYRDEVGIFSNCSHNVTFKDLNFYYIHGLGIVNQLSENILLSHVNVAPRPGSDRVIAAFADCFHFSDCYGLIRIENCNFSGSHDDPVNVHGTYLRVEKTDDRKVIVRFMHPQTWGFNAFEAGDSVELVNHETLLAKGIAVVKSARMMNKKEIELVLDRSLAYKVNENDCVENISKTPEVIILNNKFERTLTRGLLITTRRKVLIEGNTFYRTGMHAILIADDCNSWFESGPVKDVTIRNNKFLDCAYNSAPDDYVIAIEPETQNLKNGKYVHSNISIVGNKFQIFDAPLISARDVNGLDFSENRIIQKKPDGFPFRNRPMFNLEHCAGVEIQKNQFEGESFQKKILLRDMQKEEIVYKPLKEFDLIMSN